MAEEELVEEELAEVDFDDLVLVEADFYDETDEADSVVLAEEVRVVDEQEIRVVRGYNILYVLKTYMSITLFRMQCHLFKKVLQMLY